eukprot:6981210-Prorocentrum_lima.AAC.1
MILKQLNQRAWAVGGLAQKSVQEQEGALPVPSTCTRWKEVLCKGCTTPLIPDNKVVHTLDLVEQEE